MVNLPDYHTYLLSISQQIYGDVDLQDSSFEKFLDLFQFILSIDDKNDRNFPETAINLTCQIQTLQHCFLKLENLIRDIQYVNLNLLRYQDSSEHALNSSATRVTQSFQIVKKYDLFQKTNVMKLEVLMHAEFVKMALAKKRKM